MNTVHLRLQRATFALACALPLAVSHLAQAGEGLSAASEMSAMGAGSILAGSLMAVEGSAEVVVESVEWLADKVRVTLKASAKVARTVLLLPLKVAGGASLAAGETLLVVAQAGGWLVVHAGQVLAFIPNKAGDALLFSEPVGRR
jgi:hypothetical protein